MAAFIWHHLRGTMPTECRLPNRPERVPIAGTVWPNYGFDGKWGQGNGVSGNVVSVQILWEMGSVCKF